jgi:hypothetical protein
MSRSLLLASMGSVLLALVAAGCTSGKRPVSPGDRDSGVPPIACTNTADTDGDGLFDEYEGRGITDSDGDGTPDSLDTDSDNDGISDAEESGGMGGCRARNSDEDGIPDYLDNDSDNDGLSDREEREVYGTDPYNADSDSDGFTDTAEVATGHNPLDAADTIPADDYYVVLPYGSPEQIRDLRFGTNLRKADVFFMLDRTGSMTGEVAELKTSLASVVTRMAASISDIGVGVGGFAGFGGPGSGGCMTVFGIESCNDGPAGDVPFNLYGVITTDTVQMQTDVGLLQANLGGANWASSNEALFQAATGRGIAPWLGPQSCPTIPDEYSPRFGYPCFRPGALPIMVVMTDTSSKNGPLVDATHTYNPADFTLGPPPATYEQTLTELRGIGARVIGVVSGIEVYPPSAQEQFTVWARETGTVDATGTPIVFSISDAGTGLGDSLVEAVRKLAEETPQDISTTVRDGADYPAGLPPVDAGGFIKAVTPFEAYDGAVLVDATTIPRDDMQFYSVTPGVQVIFNVHFLNDFIAPTRSSQIYRATIVVLGSAIAELDQREVVIVVPAGSLPLI